MADKPDEVNAWFNDEDGNRAADLILKPEDYTETVKLPTKKPGWMQRAYKYSAGGEELEGWNGPEIENCKLIYTDKEKVYTLPLLTTNYSFLNYNSVYENLNCIVEICINNDLIYNDEFTLKVPYSASPLDDRTDTKKDYENIELSSKNFESLLITVTIMNPETSKKFIISTSNIGSMSIKDKNGETSYVTPTAHVKSETINGEFILSKIINIEDIESVQFTVSIDVY